MKQLTFGIVLCGVLAACASTSPAPVAQQAEVNSVKFSTTAASAEAHLNAIRQEAGLHPVKRDRRLDQAAQAQARHMAANKIMTHTGPDGSNVGHRVSRAGYKWCTVAENVSHGYRTQARAIEAWRASPGHYRNMIKRDAKEFGYADVDGFRVMVMGARKC